jgi:hypothetical protein
MIEAPFVAAFPVLFLSVLVAGRVAFRRRKIDMEGAPPIDKKLFRLSKVAMVIPFGKGGR